MLRHHTVGSTAAIEAGSRVFAVLRDPKTPGSPRRRSAIDDGLERRPFQRGERPGPSPSGHRPEREPVPSHLEHLLRRMATDAMDGTPTDPPSGVIGGGPTPVTWSPGTAETDARTGGSLCRNGADDGEPIRERHRWVSSLRTVGCTVDASHSTTDSSAVGQWRPRHGVGLDGWASPSGERPARRCRTFASSRSSNTGYLDSHSSRPVRWRGDEPHGRTSASPSIRVDGGANGPSPERGSLREGARPGEESTGPNHRSGSATGGKTPGSIFEGRRRNRQSTATVTVRGFIL